MAGAEWRQLADIKQTLKETARTGRFLRSEFAL